MSTSNSHSDLPPKIDCKEAGIRMRLFALGELAQRSTRELRSHLALCPGCMEQYRSTVQTTAVLGRMNQGIREERAIERQKHNLHVAHFGPRESPNKTGRNYRLRVLLLPAFVIFLLTQIVGLGDPPARVELVAVSGVVKVNDLQQANLEEPYLVLPGRWIVTSQFARAEVDGRACKLELGADTACMVESARPVRLRLERGRIDIDGTLILVSVLGLLHVSEGQGRVSIDAQGLHLDPQSGIWNFMDKSGERILAPGTPVTIAPPMGVATLGGN